jgi:putative glutamine amidotransferase
MKKTAALALSVILLLSACAGGDSAPEPLDTPTPPSAEGRDTAPTQTAEPDLPEELPEEIPAVVYEPGRYKAGEDIPAGIYMASNDGSRVSKVTLKDSPEPNAEKPNIIITSRYLTERAVFAERASYVDSVKRGGGVPVQPKDDEEFAKILREGAVEYAEILAERYDGLLLSGGGDVAAHFFNQEHHPASNPPDLILDMAEIALCRAFVKANKPVLGICRGMQVLNIAMGGELIQDIPALLNLHPRIHDNSATRHTLNVRTGTWLYELFGPKVDTNSTHHQCVDGVAQGFTIAARTGPVIEAMERGNALGVQFHPERMLDEGMLPIFEDFIERCSYGNIEIHIFSNYTIIDIKDGMYIDVTGADLQNIESTSGMFEAIFNEHGYYPEGMYLAGHHLPAGKYKLSGDSEFSSYALYGDAAKEALIYSSAVPAKGGEITLKDGQFIKLICTTLTPASEPDAKTPGDSADGAAASIISGGVRLRAEPSLDAAILEVLTEGLEVLLLAVDNGWGHVLVNGLYGYVYMDFLKIIE